LDVAKDIDWAWADCVVRFGVIGPVIDVIGIAVVAPAIADAIGTAIADIVATAIDPMITNGVTATTASRGYIGRYRHNADGSDCYQNTNDIAHHVCLPFKMSLHLYALAESEIQSYKVCVEINKVDFLE
jgi:hypothetical protein